MRFLHLADVHLDTAFAGREAAIRRRLRAAGREAFANAVDTALDEALDAVQDAMLKLVRRYSSRPAGEWQPLFYRILGNCVRDMQRRRAVRNRVIAWFGRGDATGRERDIVAGSGVRKRSNPWIKFGQ